jgi:hypothetical protein
VFCATQHKVATVVEQAARAPTHGLTIGPMFTNDNDDMARHHTPLPAIGPRRCRYIMSDGTRDAISCGAPTISDLSRWCLHHARLVDEPRLTAAERHRKAA